ncbi:MAG: alpha/beta hydrolase [Ferruginibacter sp.]|nr:alpha/beta hydrolase [Ferruginibacter sp.]
MKIQQKLAIGFFRTKINMLNLVNRKWAAQQAFRLFCTPMMKSTYKGKIIPPHAERLQFSFNGSLIKGFRFNHPQKKKVMLLHGFSSSAFNFFKYVEPLEHKGYEVLAFDAPAHGESEGNTVNAVDYSEMIKKVINLYGPVDAFIGHSFGGIAISLAIEQLPHDANTKIVLIAPATETVTAIEGAFNMLGIRNNTIRQEFDKIIFETSGKEVSWYSIRRAMNHISASVLWIHDEDDDITPLSDALQVKADGHPNIRFLITKGLGHRKIYRDEDTVNAVVKFL